MKRWKSENWVLFSNAKSARIMLHQKQPCLTTCSCYSG